ncbi:phosphotransferase family enzyme [Pseudonocardia hierapolitana]|uniref:Phosphotransferase family enzyme n=1 Tax=Pseudonocardia hierapolitana TaxID=1128676 RepID=A0A561SPG9_9PSEU|nr:aminoglycoside phosphotransferase family protein [Pseudonocardia hierapolitana]TWF76743.1 phosphotransferase family enzyme [Pseudonocardia hierapolitana]
MVNGGGARLGIDEVPERVRRAIEEILGAPVVAAHSQPGGFSPGLAARLVLADGRRAFAKAVGAERNPDAPVFHRREVEVLAALPPDLPVPRLLGSYDDGDWVALVVEDVDGEAPAEPWHPAQLARVVEAMAELADRLTPSPIARGPVASLDEKAFRGWRTLAADPSAAAPLGPVVCARLDELAAIEEGWTAAAEGRSLVHGDLRADNILLTPDEVVFVDWPHARIGAPWLDLLFLLPSAAATGTDPEEVWAAYPPARAADPDAVTAVLVALTGFFLRQSVLPPPPNLEKVRAFQRVQGEAALRWVDARIR